MEAKQSEKKYGSEKRSEKSDKKNTKAKQSGKSTEAKRKYASEKKNMRSEKKRENFCLNMRKGSETDPVSLRLKQEKIWSKPAHPVLTISESSL